MLASFRNRFGIPGVISVIALVFAMFGGAYAATNGSGDGKATASAKAKKGPRGPRGPAGPQGPSGPAGAKGDNGSAGSNGKEGPEGPEGPKGDKGDKGEKGAKGDKGEKGDKGDAGDEGSPWTAGGTLPVGSTETGAFFGRASSTTISEFTALPFSIPLATAPGAANTKVNSLATGSGELTEGSNVIKSLAHTNVTPPWVTGTPITGAGIPAGSEIQQVLSGGTEIVITQNATASGVAVELSSTVWPGCDDEVGEAATAEHPEADSGFFCVFVSKATGALTMGVAKAGASAAGTGGPSTAGARLRGKSTTSEDLVSGTFAVTG